MLTRSIAIIMLLLLLLFSSSPPPLLTNIYIIMMRACKALRIWRSHQELFLSRHNNNWRLLFATQNNSAHCTLTFNSFATNKFEEFPVSTRVCHPLKTWSNRPRTNDNTAAEDVPKTPTHADFVLFCPPTTTSSSSPLRQPQPLMLLLRCCQRKPSISAIDRFIVSRKAANKNIRTRQNWKSLCENLFDAHDQQPNSCVLPPPSGNFLHVHYTRVHHNYFTTAIVSIMLQSAIKRLCFNDSRLVDFWSSLWIWRFAL